MELILFFGLVISAFVVTIVCIVGLVNAPTPILLCILVAGIMVTQKSIDNFNESNASGLNDRRNQIEEVEIADNKGENQKDLVSMIYRGSNYN